MRKEITRDFEIEQMHKSGKETIRWDDEHRAYSSLEKYEEFLLPGLSHLRSKFLENSYALVVGEDSSGRLCTLVVGGLAKKIAKANGQKGPETKFIPGVRDVFSGSHEKIAQQLSGFMKGLGKTNIVYVTESVGQGGSIANFLLAASECRLKVDCLVAENFANNLYTRAMLTSILGEAKIKETLGELYVGPVVEGREPIIFKNPELNAVTKDPRDARKSQFSEKNKVNSKSSFAYRYNDPKLLKASREAVKQVTDNLFLEIFPEPLEIFKSVNIPSSQLAYMNSREKNKLERWLKFLKARFQNDSKLSEEKDESGVVGDIFSTLQFWINTSDLRALKPAQAQDYDGNLYKLKVFLTDLQNRT